MLSLEIPRPKASNGDDFDTLIEPLVEELELLSNKGIMTQDVASEENSISPLSHAYFSAFMISPLMIWWRVPLPRGAQSANQIQYHVDHTF